MVRRRQTPVAAVVVRLPCLHQIIDGQIVVGASHIDPSLAVFAAVRMHVNGIPEDPCGCSETVDVCHHSLSQSERRSHLACICSGRVSAVHL